MKLEARCHPIELILADVDGVLTSGRIIFNNQGIETKHFHIRDGMGIRLWQRAGYKFALITGRSSHIVNVRASELGIDIVRQGTETKLAAARDIITQLGLSPEQLCYIGDDLPDLPAVRLAGLGVAIGIPAAIAGSKLLTGLLFNVKATDPAVLASVALLVTVVALAACWIPAWRATQVAPTEALRAE